MCRNFPIDGEEDFCASYPVTKLNTGRKIVIAKDYRELLQSFREFGKPEGFGVPSEDLIDHMNIRDRESLPKKTNIAPSASASG